MGYIQWVTTRNIGPKSRLDRRLIFAMLFMAQGCLIFSNNFVVQDQFISELKKDRAQIRKPVLSATLLTLILRKHKKWKFFE